MNDLSRKSAINAVDYTYYCIYVHIKNNTAFLTEPLIHDITDIVHRLTKAGFENSEPVLKYLKRQMDSYRNSKLARSW